MILVTGSVQARSETFEDVLRLAQEHVARSRTEPGCLTHAVHRDVEDPNRLVFVETWASRETLAAHFTVPGSRQFITALTPLVVAPPTLQIFDGEDVTTAMLKR